MEENRIPVYGKDTADNEKRAFDWVLIDGHPFVETKDRYGHMVRTPANKALAAYRELQQPNSVST